MGKHHGKGRPATESSATAPGRVPPPVDPGAAWRTPEEVARDEAGRSPAPAAPDAPSGGIPREELDALRSGTHRDPHSVYGAHPTGSGSVVRTMQPGATSVEIVLGTRTVPMEPLGDGMFGAGLPERDVPDYRFRVTYPDGHTRIVADGYRFLPTLGEMDLHLINEGRHERLWTVLGAHVRTYDTPGGPLTGTSFAVWAPNARGISVVGDFCGWNPIALPMRAIGASGVWELFVPDVIDDAVYKYCVRGADGRTVDHADPLAVATEVPPATGSRVFTSGHEWNDDEWVAGRATRDHSRSPMTVLEVHVGSWRPGLGYREFAHQLADHVTLVSSPVSSDFGRATGKSSPSGAFTSVS